MLLHFIFFSIAGSIPEDATGLKWIRYIFFINLWVPAENEFWINLGAVWSISVFVFFYLLVPFMYKVVKKSYVALVLIILLYGLFKYTENVGTGRIPVRYLFYFMVGILVNLVLKEGKENNFILSICLILLFCFLTHTGEAIAPPLLAALFICFLLYTGRMIFRCERASLGGV